jgi:DNA (cytosine-5)-methyltransferase 1
LCARQNDGLLETFPIWDDVQTFDGKPWAGIVDVVSGGFPCQDISAAGGGAGIDGERSGMWREMARIICEVGPQFVFVENSPMLTSRGLGRVLGDLASMGFDARWGVLGAADIGAKHQRDRIWIVAKHLGNPNNYGQAASKISTSIAQGGDSSSTWQKQTSKLEGSSEQYAELADTRCKSKRSNQKLQPESEISIGQNTSIICGKVSDSAGIRQSGQGQHEQPVNSKASSNWKANIFEPISTPDFWAIEPRVGRVADGVAARVDRLKAIGNGQVPLCAATAWRILSEQ